LPMSSRAAGCTSTQKDCSFPTLSVSRGYTARSLGNEQRMTDAQDRERESRMNEENKFVEQTEEVAEEQREKAARLAKDPVVNESGDEE
jgi:hypothetical protein